MFAYVKAFFVSEFRSLVALLSGGTVKKDLYRQCFLFAIGLFALIPMWDASQVVLYFIGVIALFGMAVHLLRRIFFPRISLDQLAKDVLENKNIASAIVFAAIVYFMCTLFNLGPALLGLGGK